MSIRFTQPMFRLPYALLLACAVVATRVDAQVSKQQVTQLLTLTPEQAEILSHMSIVYLDDGQGGTLETIQITGVNVRIVNGLGATNGYPANPASTDPMLTTSNGLGNLIIGYNEPATPFSDRTGSHNLVFGRDNDFTSYGGFVGGLSNKLSAPFASVTGGQSNEASGLLAAICGGRQNLASGMDSWVGGGYQNTASGSESSVSGGGANVASGTTASVSGGSTNWATGQVSAISGGYNNTAGGLVSSISGGDSRDAPSYTNWAAGSLFENN